MTNFLHQKGFLGPRFEKGKYLWFLHPVHYAEREEGSGEQKELPGGRQVPRGCEKAQPKPGGMCSQGSHPSQSWGAAGSLVSHLPGLWHLPILPEKGRIHVVSLILSDLAGPTQPVSGLAACKVGGVLIFCHS